jgi:hypothetical protein
LVLSLKLYITKMHFCNFLSLKPEVLEWFRLNRLAKRLHQRGENRPPFTTPLGDRKRAQEPEVRKEAEKREKAGKPSADSAEGLKGETRDIIAKISGFVPLQMLLFLL